MPGHAPLPRTRACEPTAAPGSQPGRRPHLGVEPTSTDKTDKVYVVTRADLSVGQQITQAAHATSTIATHDPQAFAHWRRTSDSLIVLAVDTEADLIDLVSRARHAGIDHVTWRERDLADELTAVTLMPSPQTPLLVAELPLAGRKEAPERAVSRESSLRRLTERMANCEQTPGMNVLEHGKAVRETYLALLDHLDGVVDLHDEPEWRLPAWLDSHRDQLRDRQARQGDAERYLTLHDCGKPDVRTVDADGRTRFPGHAQASTRRYLKTLGKDASTIVSELIELDMLVHTGTAEDVLLQAGNRLTPTLLLSAVAEVHANAAMFGGAASDSFKGKLKRVDQRGRALIKHWDQCGWPDGDLLGRKEP